VAPSTVIRNAHGAGTSGEAGRTLLRKTIQEGWALSY
jgi:hypothetical protein